MSTNHAQKNVITLRTLLYLGTLLMDQKAIKNHFQTQMSAVPCQTLPMRLTCYCVEPPNKAYMHLHYAKKRLQDKALRPSPFYLKSVSKNSLIQSLSR